MNKTVFQGRRAVYLENETLRVTVLEEGGHIAGVFDKRAGVSPLWVPHWKSVEPSELRPRSIRISARARMPSCWRESWVTICVSTYSECPRPKRRVLGLRCMEKPPSLAMRSLNPAGSFFCALSFHWLNSSFQDRSNSTGNRSGFERSLKILVGPTALLAGRST